MKVLSLLLLLLYNSAAIPAAAAQIQPPAGLAGQVQRPPTAPAAAGAQGAQHPALEQQEIPKATLRGHVYARATGAPLRRALLTLGGGPHPGNPLRATTERAGRLRIPQCRARQPLHSVLQQKRLLRCVLRPDASHRVRVRFT